MPTNTSDQTYSWRIITSSGKIVGDVTLTNLDAATLVALGYAVTMNR
jgi:hypothetical protein